jgi:hypothetical protein
MIVGTVMAVRVADDNPLESVGTLGTNGCCATDFKTTCVPFTPPTNATLV